MKSATNIAAIEVRVIVVPVLNAPNIREFREPSFFLIILVVSKMSVSTEYPISIRSATIPAIERDIPRRLITVKVMTISMNAERTTAKLGMGVLKIKNTTRAMKMKAMIIAIFNC